MRNVERLHPWALSYCIKLTLIKLAPLCVKFGMRIHKLFTVVLH